MRETIPEKSTMAPRNIPDILTTNLRFVSDRFIIGHKFLDMDVTGRPGSNFPEPAKNVRAGFFRQRGF
jgi:hypothetical protein